MRASPVESFDLIIGMLLFDPTCSEKASVMPCLTFSDRLTGQTDQPNLARLEMQTQPSIICRRDP